MGSHPTPPEGGTLGAETVHFWGGSTTTNLAAGSTNPTTAFYTSRYSISKNRVTCTICHDPHVDVAVKATLLRAAAAGDLICQQCHSSRFISNVPDTNATLTHPLVSDYEAFAAANPLKYTTLSNSGSGDVRLVAGGVSCTSCHSPHFADSTSVTADGLVNVSGLASGDGHLLRSDGPLRTGATRDGTAGTGQLRSNLCQACHTYKTHGKGGNQQMIGCLDCHGGHSYNNGAISAYVLAGKSPDAVPVRANRAPAGTAQVTYAAFPNGGSVRTKWSDNTKGTANGFCEKCHGDVQNDGAGGLGTIELEHLVTGLAECTTCHKHGETTFSFANDANAATCGQCHGFPPYKNISGFRAVIGDANDGGWADNKVDVAPSRIGYDQSGYLKDETMVGHKTHAGAKLSVNPGEWYFVGVSGIDNCKPCHGNQAGSIAGGHRQSPLASYPNTFRDIIFAAIATTGGLVPSYDTGTSKCDNTYCHSNGGKRTGDGPTRSYAAHLTPAWVGTGASYATGGYGSIFLQPFATRCSDCHGYSAATMTSQGNSPAHNAHLGAGATGITYNCDVCHVATSDSTTASKLKLDATDGQKAATGGGRHVNGQIEVGYKTSGSTLYASLASNLAGPNYDPVTGTCSVYCHDPADTGLTADWDDTSGMQCDTCHGGIATDTSANGGIGVITSGSHTRHITTANGGPGLSCDICHGTGSTLGTQAGHLDGIDTMVPTNYPASFTDICEECHGYDAESGEVRPVWGSPATTDCATCHAGSLISDGWVTAPNPPTFTFARTTGHGRLPASGNYPVSGNAAGNSNCLDCHVATASGHFSDGLGDTQMLRIDVGFPATYSGNENSFCANCHGASPAHPTKAASVATRNITTHASKLCIACHEIHGTGNIQMVISDQTAQNTKDISSSGQFTGSVSFLGISGANSYDEDDGAAGGAGEINGNDICATCHKLAEGVTHNNSDNSTGNHYQGQDCFTCHANHQATVNAFKVGVGTRCNECHGNPPNTGAHGDGSNLHTRVGSIYLDEDRTDCAVCHTGADLYTYDLGADQAAAGARSNHAKGNRQAVLAASVGYFQSSNLWGCANVCHTSPAADSFWFDKASGSDPTTWGKDTNGISCNACHYYSTAPVAGNNLSDAHDKHFTAGKGCNACHPTTGDYASVDGKAGPLTHISIASYAGAADDGAYITGNAQATQDEAGYDEGAGVRDVVRSGMTYTDANTCSGGIALGCHATGTPDWDIVIPNTNAGCLECHTDTNTTSVNPTSGIHDNSPAGPTVTGNAHDGSFDNGSAGIADCVTCHTLTPTVTAGSHMNGTLDTGTAVKVDAAVGYAQATGTCATACHSAGAVWAYKWATSAYNTNGTECANCHGDYATGWVTGVTPHTNDPTKGNKHNNTGTLIYPCADCHAIGSAGYNWTTKWDPTGATSHHGNDKITMNQTADSTFTVNTGRAGCTVACHIWDTAHNFPVTTTTLLTEIVTGNKPDVLCSGCHGGYAPGGTTVLGYWPDGTNTRGDNASEDNSGAHLIHMTALAKAKYNENLTQLLIDNASGDGDAKQKFLCAYCHGTDSGNPMDATHGLVSQLPADVTRTYAQWDLLQTTAESGVYTPASYTCATVDCHFNKTTPTTNDWYDAPGNGTCIMCHVDVTAETAHTKHTSAATATTFGRASLCADCHEAATNWGTNTAPADGHINGTYGIAGSRMTSYVGFIYPGVKGTCGTNTCHNSGNGVGAPAVDPVWGTTQADCTICHIATPATGAHVKHMNNISYVPGGCSECHTAGSNSAHLNLVVTYAGALTAYPGVGGAGSCTNTCHLSPEAGDWTGGTSAITCTDCHSGSGASAYIGGNKTSVAGPNYMPQYNMHLLTPTVTGKVHTAAGLATQCTTCHSNLSAQSTHMNGLWTADDSDNTNDQHRGLFAGFTDGNPPTCTTACHTAGTAWSYKWSSTVTATNGDQCDNCHGTFASGFNPGVMHAGLSGRGNNAHKNSGDLSYPCTDCHAIGSTNGVYPFANSGNDWAATDTMNPRTLHGDGLITVNSSSSTLWARVGGRSGCSKCHEGADGAANAHDYPTTSSRWTAAEVVGDPPNVSGSCTACHGGAEYWPDGTVAPDRTGQHSAHVHAIAIKLGGDTAGNRNATCSYCHPDPGGSGHNDGGSAEVGPFKNILTGAFTDADGVLDGASSSCNTVDCHFNNAVTPHWYADTTAPAQVALTATTGVAAKPRSINVSWVSPGDDNNLANTTVHRYDMRYATNSTDATDFGRTDNHVGGLPLAYMQGTTQEVSVDNLTSGATYYFCLRSQDVAGNWSLPSTVVSAVASGDTVVPYFGGVNRASKGDATQTINLQWSPAEDHTMPITYKIWMKPISSGALNMDVDSPLLTGIKGYKYQLTSGNGVTNDMIYQVGVRACDGVLPTPNCDTNTHIAYATPTDVPVVAKTYNKYLANGAAASAFVTLNKDGTFTEVANTGAVSSSTTVTFVGPSLSSPTIFFSDSFSIYITNGTAANSYTATLGKSTGGTNFTSLGVASPAIPMAKNAKGLKTFKLVDAAGKQLNANERIAVRISATANGTLAWGTTGNGGTLNVGERFVNVAPLAGANPLNATVSGAIVTLTWDTYTDDQDGLSDSVHYDLYGSDDNGATWKYLIATDLKAVNSYKWNTQLEGIALSSAATVAVKLQAGDGYAHTEATKTALAVDNKNDNVAPNAINDLVVKRRAKAGSVMLRWTAPGDDAENNGRAAYYDVRYSTSPINEGNFALADRAYDAPTPGFGGHIEEMEITTLIPLTTYYFAIKAYDNGTPAKAGGISTAKYVGSDQEIGGPKCGMCHTTAPSVVESVGNHRIHGITVADCVKCHGSQVETFGLDHQDGQLLMGWSAGGPKEAIISGNRVYYTDSGLAGGNVLYDDNNNGAGGFYNGNYDGIGTVKIDDGTCMNFVAGCHGPAGSGGYGSPNWISTAKLDCADCHGVPTRTTDSFYSRAFDGTTANGGVVPEQIKGSPPIDNHGYDGTGVTEAERKYVGIHEKHLNYSFRFAKGDSCNLCHSGRYSDKNDLDGKHADSYIDVKLDTIAAGDNAMWNPGTPTTAGTCGNMSPERCHPSASTPKWDSTENFDCVSCHGFNGTTPSHVTDPNKGVSASDSGTTTDKMAGNCTWCHFGGHPRDDVGGTAIILPKNSQVGINWSTGIHLRKSIGGRSAAASEAALCWGCHDSNGISEWGQDTGSNNAATAPQNSSNYNYGTLNQSNWIGATWTSGTAAFSYKTGLIKSTHATADGASTAAITSDRFRTSNETVDVVDNIRCSNCHDVHNLNLAPGDATIGQPYLRGSWIRNPYPEDGAPQSSSTYGAPNRFMAVPRGGSAHNEAGGYQIDQNNGFPTSGLSLAASAGLCTLCHGTNVDTMDKVTGENLWLSTNGHSNSALGGTGTYAVDIFSYAWRNPSLAPVAFTGNYLPAPGNPNMGYENAYLSATTRVDGLRSAYSGYGWSVPPAVIGTYYAYIDNDWGVTQDTGTKDIGYHAFTCSKCHNPHASRLPKLMITNCLDTRQNTWDDNKPTNGVTGSSAGTTKPLSDDNLGRTLADVGSAQNCHRLVPKLYAAANFSFTAPDKIGSSGNLFTNANKYNIGDKVKIMTGTNAGKVGTISAMTTAQLTLTGITDASGNSVTLTTAAAATTTLEGARGGWNYITPQNKITP
jgi:predicted CxxxxCH...CXXCH cytochrome family protein